MVRHLPWFCRVCRVVYTSGTTRHFLTLRHRRLASQVQIWPEA